MDVEKLASEAHKIYCEQYEKNHGKPYWTNGDYSKLDEPTKEYDRVLARHYAKEILKARIEELDKFKIATITHNYKDKQTKVTIGDVAKRISELQHELKELGE